MTQFWHIFVRTQFCTVLLLLAQEIHSWNAMHCLKQYTVWNYVIEGTGPDWSEFAIPISKIAIINTEWTTLKETNFIDVLPYFASYPLLHVNIFLWFLTVTRIQRAAWMVLGSPSSFWYVCWKAALHNVWEAIFATVYDGNLMERAKARRGWQCLEPMFHFSPVMLLAPELCSFFRTEGQGKSNVYRCSFSAFLPKVPN